MATVGTDTTKRRKCEALCGSVPLDGLHFHLACYLCKNQETLHLKVNEQNSGGGLSGWGNELKRDGDQELLNSLSRGHLFGLRRILQHVMCLKWCWWK